MGNPLGIPTSQARVFTYARRCDKDPGSGWSRDTPKSGVFLISDLYFIGRGSRVAYECISRVQ